MDYATHSQNEPETLWSVLEHAVYQFQNVVENGGQHIEHVLYKSNDN